MDGTSAAVARTSDTLAVVGRRWDSQTDNIGLPDSSGAPVSGVEECFNEAPPTLRIGFLSGSARIATRDEAEVSGPRAHIIGMIDALRADGHAVESFILGDRLPSRGSGQGSRRLVTGGWPRQVAVDLVRLGLRRSAARRARRHLPGRFDLVYERYALFQHLGRSFQRSGTAWVIETNAVLSREARLERNALVLQRLAARLERQAYRQADLIVCVSDSLRDMLVADAGVPVDKVVVIPNAVDPNRFTPTSVAAGDVAGGDEFVIGYVGFVTERQGLDELIRALPPLLARGIPLRVVIVGDGPDRPRLEALAADERVRDGVTFTGQIPWADVPAAIASFSVGYSGQRGVGGMPMYHSPLKIYEYLAMARPVVASHHPDSARTLLETRAGWTFTPGDREGLVDVLAEVAQLDRQELSSCGQRGRSHVEEHHTWAHRSRQLLDEVHRRGLVAGASR